MVCALEHRWKRCKLLRRAQYRTRPYWRRRRRRDRHCTMLTAILRRHANGWTTWPERSTNGKLWRAVRLAATVRRSITRWARLTATSLCHSSPRSSPTKAPSTTAPKWRASTASRSGSICTDRKLAYSMWERSRTARPLDSSPERITRCLTGCSCSLTSCQPTWNSPIHLRSRSFNATSHLMWESIFVVVVVRINALIWKKIYWIYNFEGIYCDRWHCCLSRLLCDHGLMHVWGASHLLQLQYRHSNRFHVATRQWHFSEGSLRHKWCIKFFKSLFVFNKLDSFHLFFLFKAHSKSGRRQFYVCGLWAGNKR